MGHLTLKMISIACASFLIFGLARAEACEEHEREAQGKTSANEASKNEKQRKTDERFRAQQSINRALRDQGMQHGPVTPPAPPQTK